MNGQEERRELVELVRIDDLLRKQNLLEWRTSIAAALRVEGVLQYTPHAKPFLKEKAGPGSLKHLAEVARPYSQRLVRDVPI
jgi:hypothetical protein